MPFYSYFAGANACRAAGDSSETAGGDAAGDEPCPPIAMEKEVRPDEIEVFVKRANASAEDAPPLFSPALPPLPGAVPAPALAPAATPTPTPAPAASSGDADDAGGKTCRGAMSDEDSSVGAECRCSPRARAGTTKSLDELLSPGLKDSRGMTKSEKGPAPPLATAPTPAPARTPTTAPTTETSGAIAPALVRWPMAVAAPAAETASTNELDTWEGPAGPNASA